MNSQMVVGKPTALKTPTIKMFRCHMVVIN